MHPVLAQQPIQRIVVFRALVLGDLLCATPALRALKAAWPDAELTLIGLPWAQALAERLPQVDRFEAFCGFPGLPERSPDLDALPNFLTRLRVRPADLLVQLHGSGSVINPLLACFGARHVAGFVEPGEFCAEPALHGPWPRTGHEIERLLQLTDRLGLARCGRHLDFPVQASDREALTHLLLQDNSNVPLACVHVGAQLPSRRWLPERFAAVADQLVSMGLRVVLTGTPDEAELVRKVKGLMRADALDLSGRTTLWTLGALIARAHLLVCNDTGVQHIAAALGTPSVAISSGAEVARWAPLDATRHRVLWAHAACRPCAHRECPTAHECAAGVSADQVVAAALSALQVPQRARRVALDSQSAAHSAGAAAISAATATFGVSTTPTATASATATATASAAADATASATVASS